jgi:hypothetical protein
MEDFVPFEIAKKLKEKGFVQGFNVYGIRPIYYNPYTIKFISDIGAYEAEYFGENISCPTIPQVLKWLREEKKIHIEVAFGCCGFCWDLILNIKYIEGHDNSEWDLLDCEKYAEIDNQENHSTYEECALCAIEYLLNNII